ncbi:MAG: homoserine O-succinyltransferase [Lachnospiraceae bacterium]
MPINILKDLPAKGILERENIFVMEEEKAVRQDIRPLQIVIINLMPLKEETELQLLRSLSNTPLQVDITFMIMSEHDHKNTSVSHLNKFYVTFDKIRHRKFDGLIITGAPVENMPFEEVDYWQEMVEVFEWSKTNVTSTFYICWAAQAGLYYHYGIEKRALDAKMFGIFENTVRNRKVPLLRGMDDVFLAPQSRHTEVALGDVEACPALTVLADSQEAGLYLAMAQQGRQIFVTGHPEYDRMTLDKEYQRDLAKGMNIALPRHYYDNDDPTQKPKLSWRSNANNLYTNWLNYYVYQSTPYALEYTPQKTGA